MTPDQQRQAMRLYDRYQTTGREFRDLAASMGLDIGGLCAQCWRIKKARREILERESMKPRRPCDRK